MKTTYEHLTDLLNAERNNASGTLTADIESFFKAFEVLATPNKPDENLGWDERLPQNIKDAKMTIQRRIGYKASSQEKQAMSDAKVEAAARLLADEYDKLPR